MTAVTVTLVQGREALVSVAAVLVALGVICRYVVQPVLRFAKRLEKVMVNVEAQLYPNGGRSLRDAVDRIQESLGVLDHPTPSKENPNRKEI